MNSNKKPTVARGIPQPFNRQTAAVGQFKPVVAQLKTPVSAQSIKRPVAPPVYRPQAKPMTAQPKMAKGAVNRKPPVAPPVYRPQQLPKVLQTKSSSPASQQRVGQAQRQPIAAPVYRPQTNRIVQPQATSLQRKSQTMRPLQNQPAPKAPAAYRPLACPSRFPIQRARWMFEGGEWKRDSKGKENVIFPIDEKKFAHEPEEGDYYDEETGEHFRAAAVQERLQRIAARQKKRKKARRRAQLFAGINYNGRSKRNKNRVVVHTPGGDMEFGWGWGGQPFGGFSDKGFGEEKKIRTNYDAISETLDQSKDFGGMMDDALEYMSSVDPKVKVKKRSPRDRMGLTAISSLLTAAEPHQRRNPLGGKPERAAIRYAKKLKSARMVFNRQDGAYVPSWKGGTRAWREMIAGERHIPYKTHVMLEGYLSPSSDEEEEDGGGQRRRGKRKRK